jgi:tRNA U34 5-carboxymethylaminomethyl modifying enzyme MnmG/GidA
MATTSKVLARTAAATSSTTLYTTPAGTTTVITNIVICNPTTAGVTASLLLNDIDILGSVAVAANSTAFFDLKQVLPATQTIKGLASSTAVDFHISGVEIN